MFSLLSGEEKFPNPDLAEIAKIVLTFVAVRREVKLVGPDSSTVYIYIYI
jgi:hypothetical protein